MGEGAGVRKRQAPTHELQEAELFPSLRKPEESHLAVRLLLFKSIHSAIPLSPPPHISIQFISIQLNFLFKTLAVVEVVLDGYSLGRDRTRKDGEVNRLLNAQVFLVFEQMKKTAMAATQCLLNEICN